MQWIQVLAAALFAPNVYALLRFSCSGLVLERLDPLVNPGVNGSPHLHQIIGGNAFNVSMDPAKDISTMATCTTCTFSQDFSNYWTAVLYFKARNGTFKRVPQKGNVNFEAANGGMTIYYSPETSGKTTAFQKGFRMLIGNVNSRSKATSSQFRQLTYTCLQTPMTRSGETMDFPTAPCPSGIMANLRFPTCWDGVNLDSVDHMSHVAYPASGTFETNGPCPSTHPVPIPQLFFEVVWDTTGFNDKSLWPTDGSQPFVWSYGDATGYGTHGDYVFGWKGDSLQKAMDTNCNINCPVLTTQSIADGNKCTQKSSVPENIDGWLTELPGNMPITS
ncbi:hypothetical protein LSUE1_G001653 [Lachnellula suecica]|uniref:DUF1996 domain-containing protein n=1 Tax=Lachnellula suecica TaxID=602035 RepID=A0A8T9CJ89_9HELO|nr:hypothetical protein LSUE1_G001653 [Lachnellula suecica]